MRNVFRQGPRPDLPEHPGAPRRTPWGILFGLASLAWILLRVARKPSRLAYPCQQAALANVSLLLGVPVAAWLGRLVLRGGRRPLVRGALVAALGLVVALTGLTDPRTALSASHRNSLAPSSDYVARVYLVDNAGGPSGLHHLGVDELLTCLGAGGQPFYKSETIGPESGPNGIIAADDVVLVKINAQWNQRGGTNTDVLKGLIARILEHPDGFTGEVVVVENTQGVGSLDFAENNAEDHSQSATDVVNRFASLGKPVSAFLWDTIRTTSVLDYDQGNAQNGYVIGPYSGDVQGCVSYPKFHTAGGHFVSLKRGIWDPLHGTFDDTRLKFLTVPVLKCHAATYGVTASLKIHVGSMTTALSTNTHGSVRYGMLGKFLGEVRMPDLVVLDCMYILARPSAGPACSYAQATTMNKLMAGVDPVAIDMWATKNLLVPAILANGYTSYPMQDPDNPGSIFRIYLDAACAQLLAAGIPATNDLSRIEVLRSSALAAGSIGVAAAAGACPNPSAAGTTILFDAPRAGVARLDVYDVAGRLVRSVTAAQAAGAGRIFWDGRDASGLRLAPGTYCYRISGVGASAVGKATLIR
ncbi:MAG: DUF362 domain-containing protein [bacterium]